MRAGKLLEEARFRAGIPQAEVARRARTSQPYINRVERGLVEPSAATLRRLVRTCGYEIEMRLVPRSGIARLVDKHRQGILDRAAARGATEVRIFGSVARNEPNPADLDILVALEPGRDLVDLAALKRELSDLLGVPVDVSTPSLLRPEALDEAVREAVPL